MFFGWYFTLADENVCNYVVGHMGGLTNPAPRAEDAEPVILILVGLPCLERGRLTHKKCMYLCNKAN